MKSTSEIMLTGEELVRLILNKHYGKGAGNITVTSVDLQWHTPSEKADLNDIKVSLKWSVDDN